MASISRELDAHILDLKPLAVSSDEVRMEVALYWLHQQAPVDGFKRMLFFWRAFRRMWRTG